MSETTDPRKEILNKLLELAREGDVRAAKIYLDCTKNIADEAAHELTVEDVIQLIREYDPELNETMA